jgi:hypothetical protein
MLFAGMWTRLRLNRIRTICRIILHNFEERSYVILKSTLKSTLMCIVVKGAGIFFVSVEQAMVPHLIPCEFSVYFFDREQVFDM